MDCLDNPHQQESGLWRRAAAAARLCVGVEACCCGATGRGNQLEQQLDRGALIRCRGDWRLEGAGFH